MTQEVASSKSNKEAFRIKVYKKTELAILYFPFKKTKKAALEAFGRFVRGYPQLLVELEPHNYHKLRTLSPKVVGIIVGFIGTP